MSGERTNTRVVMICTGNVVRSPAAALLLDAALKDWDVTVSSAGLYAEAGRPIAEPMARLLRSEGLDPSAHGARPLTARLVEEADVVLGLARLHRSYAVSAVPAALKRAYTLREFARLAEQVPAEAIQGNTPGERLRRLAEVANRYRVGVPEDLDDVDDPILLGDDQYERVFDQIAGAVRVIAQRVLGREVGAGPVLEQGDA